MRVALIGLRGVPASFGGIERHVEEIGARLADRGHEVTVFCRSPYVHLALGAHRCRTMRHLPTVRSKHLEAFVHSALATLAALPDRFDVLHYHALGPGALTPVARALGRAKVVQTVHGLDFERAKWGPAARAFLRSAAWTSARVPHATVVVSQALADHYERHYGRTVSRIPNGVDPPAALPAPDRIAARWRLGRGDYLLFVGRLVPEKAPDLLLRAFRGVAGGVRLVLAGDSSFTDDYAEQVRSLADADPRVVVTGYVYGDVLAELYANARAFVLPSALEGLPIALLEAAAYGLPVVASDIPPHREVLGGDGPGRRLFRPGDEEGLIEALGRCLGGGSAEEEGAAQLSREVLAAYRWDDAAEATERLYLRLLDGGR